MSYIYAPQAVSRELRDAALDLHPALRGDDPRVQQFRRLYGHFLFCNYLDEHGRIITPHRTVQVVSEVTAHRKGKGTGAVLREFNEQVMPIDLSGYSREYGLARTVDPQFPAEILWLKSKSLPRDPELPRDRVDFATGERVSAFASHQRAADYASRLQQQLVVPLHGHTAELAGILNDQPRHALLKQIRRGWDATRQYVQELPHGLCRHLTENILLHLLEFSPVPQYSAVERSPRLFAQGVNLTQTPREGRGHLLGGTLLDLRCAQLAIVATLWGVDELRQFLADGGAIWKELLGHVGLGDQLERFKPVLKEAVYGTIYGAKRHNVLRELSRGRPAAPGVGDERAKTLLEHPFMQVLFDRREARQAQILDDGGVRNAFGQWIPCTTGHPHELRSLLCQQVQSFEMRLMLTLVPVLRDERNLRPLAWLHDGLVVHVTDDTKYTRIIARMKRVVQVEADRLGFPTGLDH
ncbi:MAG: hypothetical protein ACK47B_07045 [Armatimonadota bacterium]